MGFWETIAEISETADAAIDTLGHVEQAKDAVEIAADKTIVAKEYIEDAVALEKRLSESAAKGEPPGTLAFVLEVSDLIVGRKR